MHLPTCLCCEPLPVPTQGLCCLRSGPKNKSGQVIPVLKASCCSLLPIAVWPTQPFVLWPQPASPQSPPTPSFRLLFCRMQLPSRTRPFAAPCLSSYCPIFPASKLLLIPQDSVQRRPLTCSPPILSPQFQVPQGLDA